MSDVDTGNVSVPSQIEPKTLLKLIVVLGLIYFFQYLIYGDQLLQSMLIVDVNPISIPVLEQIASFLILIWNALNVLLGMLFGALLIPDIPAVPGLILTIINVAMFSAVMIYSWPYITVLAGYIWNALRWIVHIGQSILHIIIPWY